MLAWFKSERMIVLNSVLMCEVRVMAFSQQTPRPYTRSDIERLSPNQMGVYGIFKAGTWIYVGSGDIRERMLAHVNGDNPCINRERPTLWVSEVTANYIQREKDLIRELTPACNQRVG